MTNLNRKTILMCGVLASLGAAGGMVGDVFSLWIPQPELFAHAGLTPEMRLLNILSQKASSDLLAGSLLGILMLPLHSFGFYLMYAALRPAGKTAALLFFVASCMMATIGAGFHGSIALVGETALAGNETLFLSQMTLFIPWWWMLTGGFAVVSLMLTVFMIKPDTLFPRGCVWLSPLPLSCFGTLLLGVMILLEVPAGIIWMLMICGINFPLFVFHLITTGVLLRSTRTHPQIAPSL